MRRFPKFRDPRFAPTTLQNPNIEVRTHAQLVQAAQPVAQPLLAVRAPAQSAATPTPRHPGRSRDAGLALPFSFSLCAFMQILIASQRNIKNRRK